jgi:hypothetical protein
LSVLGTGRLNPQETPGTLLLEAESTAEGHVAARRGMRMTQSGIEPVIFRLIAQCPNLLRHQAPPYPARRFLDAFTPRKATINFVMSVCLSVCLSVCKYNLHSHRQIFIKFLFGTYSYIFQQIFWLPTNKITDILRKSRAPTQYVAMIGCYR